MCMCIFTCTCIWQVLLVHLAICRLRCYVKIRMANRLMSGHVVSNSCFINRHRHYHHQHHHHYQHVVWTVSAVEWRYLSVLRVPRTRRRIGDRAFFVAAPRVWNRLLAELKLLRSTDLFRHDLKTFLFHSVYGDQDTDWLCDAPSVF